MRKTILDCAVFLVLMGSISTATGAVPDESKPSDPPENENQQNSNRQNDTLPGKITDPNIVLPPDDRTSYSGSPASWNNFIPDSQSYTFTIFDRLEYGASDKGDSYLWDIQGWVGGDRNKFWWKTEGEGPTSGDPETVELQALYNRTIAPFWGVQAGVRYDNNNSGPETSYAVLGLQGTAPYRFETSTALFVSEDGDFSFRGEFEYDFMLTQRLVLQPRMEFSVRANEAPELGLGSGVNNTEAGLRMRYEIMREFAPYIGVRWEKLYGDTRDIARGAGEPTSVTSFVLGFRIWF